MMTATRTSRQGHEGLALLLVLGYLAIVMIGSTTFYALLNATLSQSQAREDGRTCLHLAEAGVDKAIAELQHDASDYRGEKGTVLGKGRFTVNVKPMERPQCFRITSTGLLKDGRFVKKRAHIVAEVSLVDQHRVDVLRWSEGKS